MVKITMNFILDVLKINNHAIIIELFRLAENRHNPVVSVQILAFALIRKIEVMTACNLHSF